MTMTTTQTRAVGVQDVAIDDPFWSPRQRILRTTTLHAQYDQLVSTGRLGALALTWTPGSDEPTPHPFWESDIAKWLEAASFALATDPDPELKEKVNTAVAALAGAQQDDGYLNVYFTVVKPGERFTDLRDAHELYCAGHLIEAGVAHFQATGERTLLEVVCRYADLLCEVFGPGGQCEGGYCGHEEVELALVQLARVTGQDKYLGLARTFLNSRGTQPHYFDVERERRGTEGFFGTLFPHRDRHQTEFQEYNQSHAPVRRQTQAVGHSVRAMYLYSAMADVAAHDGDGELWDATTTLWQHLTQRRMYVTAGIGSSGHNEGFTRDYHLPNDSAYAETCAAIGLVFWARRMATYSGDASYMDIAERALYNGAIAGMSADGTKYFYVNPLSSDGSAHRSDWFTCACCPPNLARLEASLGTYAYSVSRTALHVDLYLGSTLTTEVGGHQVRLRQHVDSPVPERVRFGIDTEADTDTEGESSWALRLRMPSWADSATVSVNGQALPVAPDAGGYLTIDRSWAGGDELQLDFSVPVRRVYANTEVSAAAGRTALTYGPFVYCIEGLDVDAPAHSIVLGSEELQPEPDAHTGVPALQGPGSQEVNQGPEAQALYSTNPPAFAPTHVRAVPYFSWNNRGQSTMAVWLRYRPAHHN